MTPRGDRRQRATLVAVPVPVNRSPEAISIRWFADVSSPGGAGEESSLALLGAFAELIDVPQGDAARSELVPRVVAIAQRALPEASDITINVGDPRHPSSLSSSSAQAQAADAAQMEAGEGPCVQSFLTDQVVFSADLQHDPRWPLLSPRLGDIRVKATLGVPIRGESGVLGVLNLYAPEGSRLDGQSVRVRAELFARGASSLLEDSQREELLREEARHLRQALVSRPEIDQAKGILMARFGYSADDAFRHLVAVSQKRNVKLRDIARDIVARVQQRRPTDEEERSGSPAGPPRGHS
jgi:GAF domain-containing protein